MTTWEGREKRIGTASEEKVIAARTGVWQSRVVDIKHLSSRTEVHLEDRTSLLLRPHLYVRRGEVLEVETKGDLLVRAEKVLTDPLSGRAGRVKLFPPYVEHETIYVPPHEFHILFRERMTSADWREAKLLEQFHYRGKGLNKLVGRRTVLLVELEGEGIIGYGVVSCTVAATRPRFELLDVDFLGQMRTKLINSIVRIPRIVIHPEFRGMGLGVLTAKHLVEYVKAYWDIRGHKPILVEVIASMTEYHPFFEKAGFIPAGRTAGYKKKIFIPTYGVGSWEARPNYKNYDFIRNGNPKPYLVYPLNKNVQDILVNKGLVKESRCSVAQRWIRLRRPIVIEQISLDYKVSNEITERGRQVRNAFGIDQQQLASPVLRDFSLRMDPGDVVLVAGASGSGKSTVMRLLTETRRDLRREVRMRGKLVGHRRSNVAILGQGWDKELPLIDQLGGSVREAIYYLNGVGLGEAHLYLKKPSQISDGQRYRFAVAMLCHSKKPVWVADEFVSTLDPRTAAVVAKGFRKIAWLAGATAILAAPHIDAFVDSLLPNKIVFLRWGGVATTFALRLRHKSFSDRLVVWVENLCARQLSDIRIIALDSLGVSNPLHRQNRLPPHQKTEKIRIAWEDLSSSSAIAVRTGEHIGDVLYFSHTSRVH